MSEIKAYLNFHFIFLIFSYLTILSTAFFPSMNPLGMQFGQRISYLWRNSWKRILFGKPCLQILIPSNTPLHLSCSRTSGESIFPALRRTNSEKCWYLTSEAPRSNFMYKIKVFHYLLIMIWNDTSDKVGVCVA